MATITGYTADRMKVIEDGTIVDGEVVGDNLILTKHDGTEINAGSVRGPQGVEGPAGAQAAPTRQIFTSGAGTYTRPDNVIAILVECIGGGGGGGGAGAGGNGTGCVGVAQGGAAGQYASKLIANPSASYAYSVGVGGPKGGSAPTAGTAGGDTTFGTTVVRAKGGAGGAAGGATYIGANGGTTGVGGASGSEANGIGDVVVAGGSGGNGIAMTGGNGSTTRFAHGACGGASYFGSGGQGGVGTGAATPGIDGFARGSGGGGGALIDGGWGDGGKGAPGIIIITEFYG